MGEVLAEGDEDNGRRNGIAPGVGVAVVVGFDVGGEFPRAGSIICWVTLGAVVLLDFGRGWQSCLGLGRWRGVDGETVTAGPCLGIDDELPDVGHGRWGPGLMCLFVPKICGLALLLVHIVSSACF